MMPINKYISFAFKINQNEIHLEDIQNVPAYSSCRIGFNSGRKSGSFENSYCYTFLIRVIEPPRDEMHSSTVTICTVRILVGTIYFREQLKNGLS